MIDIKVKGQVFKMIENWGDLTLEQGIALHKIAFRLPKEVKELYALSLGELSGENNQKQIQELQKELSEHQKIRLLPQLYGEFIGVLTTIDQALIDKLTPLARTNFYNKYLLQYVLGILFFPVNFSPIKEDSFNIEGVKYYYPKSRRFMVGTEEIEEPFIDGTALEFTEVADLEVAAKELEGGRFEMAANIIAILCRPEGEKYNEQVSLKRVPILIKHLRMDIVWQVFFYITKSFSTVNNSILTSLKEVMAIQKEMHQT